MASFHRLRQRHPLFFWGMLTITIGLLLGAAAVGMRVPQYQREAALLDQQMDAAERATRDRVLASKARRAELAVALIQREVRLKALQTKGLHLALSVQDSMLSLRHGPATLRSAKVSIGPDSIIHAEDGRSWRFVRALGERHIAEKQTSPTYLVPEWVYIGRGQPVPPEAERRVKGALGRYVLRLDDGTEIYSQPQAGPLAQQVKPAGFMAQERDLRAIFDAVRVDTPVFVY